MSTLQMVYDKLDGLVPGKAPVPKTGQLGCWTESGSPISCSGTGQDGEYQTGASVGPRFTDNGDGTVKDNLTGLIWLRDSTCFGVRDWANALLDANTLANGTCGLTDSSVAGAWRLPNLRELQSLIDYGRYSPALPLGHPFVPVTSDAYWSSSTVADSPNGAWVVNLIGGAVGRDGKAGTHYVWPVRGGQ